MFRSFSKLTKTQFCRYSTESNDVIVIGGGPGGYVCAIKAAQLGLKTTIIEKRGALGGTCLNVGCIPSKALLNTTHKYHEAGHKFAQFGIKVEGVSVDVPTMLKSKDTAVSALTKGVEHLMKKNKITYIKGTGKITGNNEVTVTGLDGKVEKVTSKNIIIATGSDATPLPGVAFDEKIIVSSTGALDFPTVPKKLLVIGAGVIGLELGSVWSRLGSEVTVIEFLDRITPGLDLEVAKSFQQTLTKQGIKFELGTKVVKTTVENGKAKVVTEPAKGGEQKTWDADAVLVSIGRRPFTDSLGAKEIGIVIDGKGRIETDKHFRTNIPNIYAIGDVITGPMLAHKAEDEGIACAEIISGKSGHVNYDCIPGVIYTYPEVASVGKTEEELKTSGIKYKVGKFPMIANSRAKTVSETDGFVKILTDDKDKILGAHIIASQAGEMIAELVLGMEYDCSAEDIWRTTHAHPTLMEAVKEAAMAATDKPINF
jgi:dihydrolipoamide dehydrogenase